VTGTGSYYYPIDIQFITDLVEHPASLSPSRTGCLRRTGYPVGLGPSSPVRTGTGAYLVQTGNKPSLHMVLLSTFILRNILSSTEELQRFFADFNNEEKENNGDVDKPSDSEDYNLNIETEPTDKTFTLITIYLIHFMKVLHFSVSVWNVYLKIGFN
jgi:hypothetical protein